MPPPLPESEQLLALHREVHRAPDHLQHEADAPSFVVAAGPYEQPRRAGVDRLEHEGPRDAVETARISVKDERALRLDLGNEEALHRRRRPGHQVAHRELLQLGMDPVGARKAAVVETVVAVPAAAATTHLTSHGQIAWGGA
jgi:hypothetical protein